MNEKGKNIMRYNKIEFRSFAFYICKISKKVSKNVDNVYQTLYLYYFEMLKAISR